MLPLDPYEKNLVREDSTSTVSSATVPPANDGSTSSSSPTPLRVATPKMDGGHFSRRKPRVRPDSVEHELCPAARSEHLEIEDIEDSDLEEDCRGGANVAANIPTFAPGGVQCTCAQEVAGPGVVKGRVPTPVLRRSASPTRHHLDLTTPSGDGLLIPSTTYPQRSPKFRRDMRGTAPVNPLPDETVDRLIQDSRKAKKPARVEVSSVAKHIPASSSPHHAHCVPSGNRDVVSRGDGAGSRAGGRERRSADSPHHVRKLNFDRQVPSKQGPKRSHSLRSSHSTRWTTAPRPVAKSLSCQSCGTCLQPGVPPPSSAPPRDGRPMAQTLYPATLNTQTDGLPRHDPAQRNGASQKLASSQRFRTTSREPVASPTPNGRMEASRSPTPPPPGTHPPAAHGGVQTRPRASYQTHEVDDLSLSSMSLSSCSVASEILEKAKKRRDHFWTSQHQTRE